MDIGSVEYNTWEQEDSPKTNFPTFSLQECNFFRGLVCYECNHTYLYCIMIHSSPDLKVVGLDLFIRNEG